MKKTTLSFLIVSLGFAVAEPAKTLVNIDDKELDIYITAATPKGIAYRDNPIAKLDRAVDRKKVRGLYFYRPTEFQNGIEAYNDGKFSVAKAAFSECKTKFAKIDKLPQNYSISAAFYEMECARRMRELGTLAKLQKAFRPDTVVNENYLNQLQIYPFWELYHKASWDKLTQMYDKWKQKKLPGYQKAQLAYCYGSALKELGKKEEAVLQLTTAIALSEYKEPELIADAADKIIEILLADPQVEEALKAKEQDESSKGYQKLLEAASVARTWESLKNVRTIPQKYKRITKFKPKQPE